MRKFGLMEIILGKGISMQHKKSLLALPKIYVCDSVRDFEVQKESIRTEYSSIVFRDVHLSAEETYNNKLCKYRHDDGNESLGFWISDNHTKSNVLWPLLETIHLSEETLDSFINKPRCVDYVISIYNSDYKNNFIMMVGEDSYQTGIEQLMEEIWPTYDLK